MKAPRTPRAGKNPEQEKTQSRKKPIAGKVSHDEWNC
jgi:hypothetical protein